MVEQNYNRRATDTIIGRLMTGQENLEKSLQRIEEKMDTRNRERHEFEIQVRRHMTQQEEYQEATEKLSDYIEVHVKPEIATTKANAKWIKEVGSPLSEQMNTIKNRVIGAAALASLAFLGSWKAIIEFIKSLGAQ